MKGGRLTGHWSKGHDPLWSRIVVDLSISRDCLELEEHSSAHHAGKIIHQTATLAGEEPSG